MQLIIYRVFSLNFTSFITVIFASVSAQGTHRFADTEPKYVATQEGQSINLMCRIAQPIATCRFTIPGESNEVKLNPSWTRNDNFRYYGNGLANGQCGVTIMSVREEYHGNVTCRLDPDDGLADAVGVIEIGKSRKYQTTPHLKAEDIPFVSTVEWCLLQQLSEH